MTKTVSAMLLIVGYGIQALPTLAQEIPEPEAVKAVIGHLGAIPVPPDNPLTRAKADLGQRLFEDTLLAGDGSLSCQSCHLPDHGFAVPAELGPAYPSKTERRHSPTLVNVAWNLPLIWDGRAGSLDKQALGPIANVLHLNNNPDLIAEQLKLDPDYRRQFSAAFGDEPITPARIGQAIAAYERTLVFDDSRLDRYMDGDTAALDDAQKRGLGLFLGKANCIACHNGPNLTDNQFYNLGVPDTPLRGNEAALAALRFDAKRLDYTGWADLDEDPGRALVTQNPADRGAFRTMGLRNIEQSPPYMHNGALTTLEDVVAFYNDGGGGHANKSDKVRPLGLDGQEQQDLVAFLKALTGKQRALDLP